MRDKPAGTVRINAHDHAIATVLWPRLLPMLQGYPDIRLEFSVDYAAHRIAAHRFDAGVRIGNRVDKDMVAVRIGQICAWLWPSRLSIWPVNRFLLRPMI